MRMYRGALELSEFQGAKQIRRALIVVNVRDHLPRLPQLRSAIELKQDAQLARDSR